MTIRITSKQDGFRRCGVAHPKEATEYPDKAFNKEQLAALQAEPMLVVEILSGESGEGNGGNRPNAKESIAAVVAAATLEELNALAEGEDRKSVVDAIAKRRTELETPQQ